jgi:aspartate aminotransferase
LPERLHPHVRELGTSATLAINERAAELLRQGRKVYRLGLGQSPFPVPGLVVEALRRHAAEKDYLPVRGLPGLREAVAEFHWLKDKVEARPDRVLIGPGSKELMFLLQLVFRGEILIPSPSWVSYLPQARILGRSPRCIPLAFEDGWKIQPHHLRELLRETDGAGPQLLILNYPNNPVGNTYALGELTEIAEIARRHQLLILSDEIYGQLHFEGEHVSIGRFYPEGTIISSGLSKWCGAGGWRLGTFTFPKDLGWLLDAMAAVASETYTSVSAPIQYAAIEAFRCGVRIESYLVNARRILKALGLACQKILQGAGVRTQLPEGGFYLFVDFGAFAEGLAGHGIRDGESLCERLLQDTGVAILPGSPFGRDPGELTARLAFVDFDGAAALAESREIPLDCDLPADFLERRCDQVLEALRRMVGWLKEINYGGPGGKELDHGSR